MVKRLRKKQILFRVNDEEYNLIQEAKEKAHSSVRWVLLELARTFVEGGGDIVWIPEGRSDSEKV